MSNHREYSRSLEGGGISSSVSFWNRLRVDLFLMLVLLSLSLFGLVILYSASNQHFEMVYKQGQYLLGGFVVLFFCAHLPPLLYRQFALILYTLGFVLLVLVLLVGEHSKGAQRWLEIPGVTRFQPSELMKIGMPLMVALYLGKRNLPPRFKHFLAVVFLVMIPAALIAKQPDLGTAILVASSGFSALLFAGLRVRYLVVISLLGIAAAWPIWQFVLHDYQRTRILTLLDPERDRFGAGWNILQSKVAIGSGGWNGTGYLQGTQSQLNFLPESHTDFVLAVLSEEWGFLGVSFVLMLYFCIIARLLVLAWAAHTIFNKLVVASVAMTFFVYVFVNVGMVSGMLPVVGVPLPFISRGGTSIVSLMIMLGIAMALASEKRHFSQQ